VSRGVLAAGLPSNVARTEVMREAKGGAKNGKKSFRFKVGVATAGDNSRCFIHPTSVLSEKELPDAAQAFLVYEEKCKSINGPADGRQQASASNRRINCLASPLARGSAWAGGRDHTPSRVPRRWGYHQLSRGSSTYLRSKRFGPCTIGSSRGRRSRGRGRLGHAKSDATRKLNLSSRTHSPALAPTPGVRS
jgi:hypothetical protein